MIPSTTGFLDSDLTIEEQPSKTYAMQLYGTHIVGYVDGIEAVKQAVFRILSTERYKYVIYPWDYGIETHDLYGEPVTWVCPELQRRIEEALSTDKRIVSVDDFEFDTSVKHVIRCSFTVHTIYGNYEDETEVAY